MKRITILIADDDAEIAGLVALHLWKKRLLSDQSI